MTYEKPELRIVDQAHVAILDIPCPSDHKPDNIIDEACGNQLSDGAYSVDE